MELLHYRRQTINLRQIKNLVRTKSKILHRDIRTAVIGKRIFIDGDFHF